MHRISPFYSRTLKSVLVVLLLVFISGSVSADMACLIVIKAANESNKFMRSVGENGKEFKY